MSALYIFRFTVEGSGEFPFDMLRYDECFPRHESEARGLARTYANGKADINRHTVELVSRGRARHWLPNVGRWRSFGWEVKPVSIVMEKHA